MRENRRHGSNALDPLRISGIREENGGGPSLYERVSGLEKLTGIVQDIKITG
jgi:hypothetical protein